ncbi:hypothetical protein F5Y18DRAFT_440344 [Xylariaceae sp. FL1019]|nr:hypothetical protein F5Y18DRAFT_440344 [Xylariaceae sp. FL1019]
MAAFPAEKFSVKPVFRNGWLREVLFTPIATPSSSRSGPSTDRGCVSDRLVLTSCQCPDSTESIKATEEQIAEVIRDYSSLFADAVFTFCRPSHRQLLTASKEPTPEVLTLFTLPKKPTIMSVQRYPGSPPRLAERNPTSLIESQPLDVHVALLSNCESVADLNAIIHASPIIYSSFLQAKRTILVALLVRDLGPGIRDAVALALIGKLHYHHDAYENQAKQAIQQYSDLPPAKFVTRKITTDTIVKMVQINRMIQFWTDMYASITLECVDCLMESGSYPIKLHERHHVGQALLRYQTMMDILGDGDDDDRGLDTLVHNFFGMFQAWEMEQVHAIHVFFLRFRCGDGSGTWFGEHIRDVQDPIAYGRRICAQGSVSRLRKANIESFIETLDVTYDPFWSWLRGSHDFFAAIPTANPPPNVPLPLGLAITDTKLNAEWEQLSRLELEKPKLTSDQHAVPYAWRDAMGGLDCCRWGTDLIFTWGPEQTTDDLTMAESKLNIWRHTGFMFWEEDRIELIKIHHGGLTAGLTDFHADWLGTIWEDVRTLRRTPRVA